MCSQKNVGEWLQEIGLTMYTAQFLKSLIISPSNMEILKTMSLKDIKNELGITKRGNEVLSVSFSVSSIEVS